MNRSDTLVLTRHTEKGEELTATFLPNKGMNLISLKKGDLEVIDLSTLPLFEERFAGLGALIGPHFHRRNPAILPKIEEESLFPHIARVRAKGTADPFSHGIARYAPWKVTSHEAASLKATLTGKDLWNGIALAALEGQNFVMQLEAALTPAGLQLNLSIVSDFDSVVGIHYYYYLPEGKGRVISAVQPEYLVGGERRALPSTWNSNRDGVIAFNLDDEADFTFFPAGNRSGGEILLDAGSYQLTTRYRAPSQENSWQLYHPKGASFVCIEPLSAQDPRHPNLTVSSIQIELEIR